MYTRLENFDIVSNFTCDGIARISKYDKDRKSKLFGYINSKHEILIPPICDVATAFHNGYAKIKIKEKDNNFHYYIIDTKGNKILNVDKYKYIGEMYNGLFRVSSEEIDDYDCISDDQTRGCFGFIDITGKEIIKPQFFMVSDFKTDYISAIRTDGYGWGILDKEGNTVIPFIYLSMLNPFCVKDFNGNNRHFVEVFICDDKTILPEDFAWQEGKWDVLDIQNNKLLGLNYDDCVSCGQNEGYINSTINKKPFIYDLLTNKFLNEELCNYSALERNKFSNQTTIIITDNNGNIISKHKKKYE